MSTPERPEHERNEPPPPIEPTGGAPADAVAPEEPMLAPPPRRIGDWRSEIVTVSGLNVLAGIWLVVSPFALGYGALDAYWNPIVFGAIVLITAVIRMLVPASRTAWVSAINMVIGLWLFLSAFWLANSGEAITNAWVMGFIVFVLAVWSGVTSGRPGKPRAHA